MAASEAKQDATFSVTGTKLYVTLSAHYNSKLLDHLKSAFKRIINWNRYQLQITAEMPNQYLDYLVEPGFQGVNRLFVLSFAKKCTPHKLQMICYSGRRNKRLHCYD